MYTPEQKIKYLILQKQASWADLKTPLNQITPDNVDEVFEEENEDWGLQDSKSEVRCGEVETHLSTPSSRHYESKAVAAQFIDGSWVGWTYWYGGGKHGEPEAIDWMDEAYDLNCEEQEKLVVVQTFTRA